MKCGIENLEVILQCLNSIQNNHENLCFKSMVLYLIFVKQCVVVRLMHLLYR
jgi:pantothenate kinase